MQIISFLPSATGIAYALGLEEYMVGVTHECDFPPQIKSKSIVVRSTIDTPLNPAEIDAAVSQRLKDGRLSESMLLSNREAVFPASGPRQASLAWSNRLYSD